MGVVAQDSFRSASHDDVRMLEAGDEAALQRLADACDPVEWAHSGIRWGEHPVFGNWADGELIAAGTLVALAPELRHVGILTHPAHRGRGCGRAVVRAMTAHALQEGCLVQYRTLMANTASMAIARSLGFREYATTVAVRFR